jgi:hypothetical protein
MPLSCKPPFGSLNVVHTVNIARWISGSQSLLHHVERDGQQHHDRALRGVDADVNQVDRRRIVEHSPGRFLRLGGGDEMAPTRTWMDVMNDSRGEVVVDYGWLLWVLCRPKLLDQVRSEDGFADTGAASNDNSRLRVTSLPPLVLSLRGNPIGPVVEDLGGQVKKKLRMKRRPPVLR